jgi:hypothetical protein
VEGGWLLKKAVDKHNEEFDSERGYRTIQYRRV